jgi:uncharacterized membrane protein YedE/YeeE
MGATMCVYFLITTGTSKATIIAVGATAIVSVMSRIVFGVLWKAPKPLDAPTRKANEVKKAKGIKTIRSLML